MAQAVFSRLVPFYLIAKENADDSVGFDAYPVEVDDRTLAVAEALRQVQYDMNELFNNMPAPEEGAQQEAVHFEELITEVIDAFNA